MKNNPLVNFPTSSPSPKSLLFLNQGRARLRGDKPEAKSAAFLAAHDKLVAVSRNCIFEDTLIYYRGREKLSNFFLSPCCTSNFGAKVARTLHVFHGRQPRCLREL